MTEACATLEGQKRDLKQTMILLEQFSFLLGASAYTATIASVNRFQKSFLLRLFYLSDEPVPAQSA